MLHLVFLRTFALKYWRTEVGTSLQFLSMQGVSMVQAAVRRAPHCFNLLRQVKILQRAGGGGVVQQMKAVAMTRQDLTISYYNIVQFAEQDWETAAGVARAFSIGKRESEAVHQLVSAVPEVVRDMLEAAVKRRGMLKFLNHEVVGKGTFSAGYTSGTGSVEAWAEQLTNRGDLHDLVPRYG